MAEPIPQWTEHLKQDLEAAEARVKKDAEDLDALLKEELISKPKSLIKEVEEKI